MIQTSLPKYFFLKKDCPLVEGVCRGALYDLISGNVFSVSKESVRALQLLNAGKSVNETAGAVHVAEPRLRSYLAQLSAWNLGRWERKRTPQTFHAVRKSFRPRYVLHVELTTGCNLHCLHCYNESGAGSMAVGKSITLEDWKRIIKDVYKTGCRRVQFIGGEPFLKRELLFSLISYARNKGYTSIEISTNGTLMRDEDLLQVKTYGAQLAFSCYSYRGKTHDIITQRVGSWERTAYVIKKAIDMGIPVRVAIVAMRQNERDVTKTVECLKKWGVKNIKSTMVEPVGRACGQGLMSRALLAKQVRVRPRFERIDQRMFWRNKVGHNCFSEQICVGADGRLYPCLAERRVSYGTITRGSARTIFLSARANRIRGLSKDRVEVCRDCEYRYCCFDCRVRARDFLESKRHPKPWWCSYNPYHGVWEGKERFLKGGEEQWKIQPQILAKAN
ncbi:MAG: radical SAM protein [Patescibacteria group bacterium]